ncbi:hypothetical protein BDN71DRAFT_1503168 [Pleurotus eryngii]|uniref:Uncharacterized protein n=1 Tax=Pleurotus eryngii TaxID=5323 RepID=A0A9P6A3M6_PLEER|nr:hypothetical protein BDN71DRAFT_1503168 [Pleurotus eryngii]
MLLALKLASLVALATMATAIPAFSKDVEASVVSDAEFDNWLRTTDANLTFIGSARKSLISRNALATRVVYCNRRSGSVCGGDCTVYEGGSACLNAPRTSCLSATTNVAFCDRGGCRGSCNTFNSCGTRLDGGFCYTPGTASINVPF